MTEDTRTWRCFHCDQLFTNVAAAAAHFGTREDQTPACQVKASEGGLLRAIREAEDEVECVHTQLHAESADGLRALQNNLGRHRTALVSAEETGYERGLRDQARTVEVLRRLLVWHGDPVRLARTREDWQQEVDEAVRFVNDNPEEGYAARPTIMAAVGDTPMRHRCATCQTVDGHEPGCPENEAPSDLAAAWERVSNALDDIPSGMHAELEDAASAMWEFLDKEGGA